MSEVPLHTKASSFPAARAKCKSELSKVPRPQDPNLFTPLFSRGFKGVRRSGFSGLGPFESLLTLRVRSGRDLRVEADRPHLGYASLWHRTGPKSAGSVYEDVLRKGCSVSHEGFVQLAQP